MNVYVTIAAGRSFLPADLADLTSVPVLSIEPAADGWFVVELDGDVDEATVTAIRTRMGAASDAEESTLADVVAVAEELADAALLDESPTVESLQVRVEQLVAQVQNLVALLLAPAAAAPSSGDVSTVGQYEDTDLGYAVPSIVDTPPAPVLPPLPPELQENADPATL